MDPNVVLLILGIPRKVPGFWDTPYIAMLYTLQFLYLRLVFHLSLHYVQGYKPQVLLLDLLVLSWEMREYNPYIAPIIPIYIYIYVYIYIYIHLSLSLSLLNPYSDQ